MVLYIYIYDLIHYVLYICTPTNTFTHTHTHTHIHTMHEKIVTNDLCKHRVCHM